MTRVTAIVAMLLVSLVAGAPGAPIPASAKKPALYFPVQKGARWVYGWSGENQKELELVCEVTDVNDGNDRAKDVMVGHIRNEKAYPMQEFEVSDRGVFLVARSDDKASIRLECLLKLPHKDNQIWSDDFSGTKETLTAFGPEKVKVPAGEYDAIRVKHRNESSKDQDRTYWYAVEVGIVKMEGGNRMVLKSFTPGKE